MSGDSVSITLCDSVPWHRVLAGADLSRNVRLPDYQRNEVNGHMVKVIGPAANDTWIDLEPIVTGAGVLWSYIVFVQGMPQFRHCGKAYKSPAEAAAAAEAYCKKRQLL